MHIIASASSKNSRHRPEEREIEIKKWERINIASGEHIARGTQSLRKSDATVQALRTTAIISTLHFSAVKKAKNKSGKTQQAGEQKLSYHAASQLKNK